MPQPSPSPAVSVVLPAFNREGSIRMAIESVLRQSWTDFELLVVDDGSVDATMARAAEVADPRLRLIAHPHNMGASAARNTGIREARGEWVAFQDSDDEWLPLKLEKQMARIAAAGEDCVACYCGMAVVGGLAHTPGARTRLRYIPDPAIAAVEGDILPALLQRSLASTQTLVARRAALAQAGGFDEGLPALEDWDCALRLAQLGPFAFVDEPLVMQHFSANSITQSAARMLAARERIIGKNRGLFDGHPGVLAQHYRSLAGGHRQAGDAGAARRAILQALRLRPAAVRNWVMLGYLAFCGILPGKGKGG